MNMKVNANTYLRALGLDPLPTKSSLNGWKGDLITPKQKSTLYNYGIAYAQIKYKGQASMIISIIQKRAAQNLATPKQIQMLLNLGYSSGRIKQLTMKTATKKIKEMV